MTWPTKTDFVDGDVLNASQMNNIGSNLNVFDPTSATNGQVLTANGAGSAAYQTLSTGAYTLISSGSLTTSTVTIGSIPGTYKHLELWLSFTTGSNAYLYLEPTGFSAQTEGWLIYSLASGTPQLQQMSGGSDGAIIKRDNTSKFIGIARVENYTSTTAKTIYCQGGRAETSGSNESQFAQSVLNYTSAVTSLTLTNSGGVTFSGGSTYSLYGVK